jgi:hypothetical protein
MELLDSRTERFSLKCYMKTIKVHAAANTAAFLVSVDNLIRMAVSGPFSIGKGLSLALVLV